MPAIAYYQFIDGAVSGIPARIARTGYTGEDGFEIYIAPEEAQRIWNEILDAGQEFGIKPCGLGARNTLRLEAKMALYGHEIHASITPLEADLAWIVKLDKGEFHRQRRAAETERTRHHAQAGGLRNERPRHRPRRLRSLRGRRSPPAGSPAEDPRPTLNKNIGLCYLPVDARKPGQSIQIMIRNQPVDAVTVADSILQASEINNVSRKLSLHQRTRVGARGRRHWDASASPITRRRNWATSCTSILPKVGARLEQGKTLGSVESVKAVSDIYAPVSGEVVEVNETARHDARKIERGSARRRLAC